METKVTFEGLILTIFYTMILFYTISHPTPFGPSIMIILMTIFIMISWTVADKITDKITDKINNNVDNNGK
jgi:hypothetical protein